MSVCHINNELGTLIDIAALSTLCHKYDTLLHIDATQSFAKYRMPSPPCVDFLSVSGHKFGTPVGIGLFIINKNVFTKFKYFPLVFGTQNNNMRGGTQSGFLIASLFYSLFNQIPRIDAHSRIVTKYRYIFFKNLFEIFPNAITYYNGSNTSQLDKFFNITDTNSLNSSSSYLSYLKSEKRDTTYSIIILVPRPITDEENYANFMILISILLIKDGKIMPLPKREVQEYLAKKHILVGIGSACSVTSSSHVYKIFANELQQSVIRITFSEENRLPEIHYFLTILQQFIQKHL